MWIVSIKRDTLDGKRFVGRLICPLSSVGCRREKLQTGCVLLLLLPLYIDVVVVVGPAVASIYTAAYQK